MELLKFHSYLDNSLIVVFHRLIIGLLYTVQFVEEGGVCGGTTISRVVIMLFNDPSPSSITIITYSVAYPPVH